MWISDTLLVLLRAAVVACAACLTFALALPVARLAPVERPSWGARGRNRAAARLTTPALAALEPALSQLAGIARVAPWPGLRVLTEGLVRRAGDAAGLCADEILALSTVTLLLGFGLGTWLMDALDLDPLWLPCLTAAGALVPAMRLDAIARERAKALERSLPSAMDLCVLCMGAGTDFPTALGFATRELGVGHEVCREELSVLLEQLSLGRTRVEALEDLSLRSGSHTVQQFVAAVCQSETKGTPLSEALSIQSATLRQRRSVLAEEMAAKAGVRMMLPLMLMVGSVLLVIFGPFIINGLGI